MRYKTWFLGLIPVIIIVSITGCGLIPVSFVGNAVNTAAQRLSDDVMNNAAQRLSGDVAGEIGKTCATIWFEFTVHSIKEVDAYAGYTPTDDCILYDVVITETNTINISIQMGSADFYMDDPSFEEYIWPIAPLDDAMMPEFFYLAPDETVQYHLVFEIPSTVTELMFMYTEIDDIGNYGRTFTIPIDHT